MTQVHKLFAKNKQEGLGAITLLIVLAVAGFFLLCFFRIGPAYLDNHSISSALKSIADNNSDVGQLEKSEIRKQLTNFMLVNGVRHQKIKDFDIKRDKEKIIITNIYEVKVPILANVEALVTFKNQLDSSNPEECCKYLIEIDEEQ